MQNQGTQPAGGASLFGTLRLGAPSIAFAALVIAAAVFSFSPRPLPDFPETQLQATQILVTGLSRSGGHYVAVGDRGRILLADHEGGPWRDADIPDPRGSTLTAVLQLNDNQLLAAGHDLWILRSEDSGESWTEVHYDGDMPEPLLALGASADGGRVFAVGGFGQYLVSDDGGRSWRAERHEEVGDHHLNGVVTADHGTLLLVGEQGTVLRSVDDGQSWQRMELEYTGSLFGALWLGDTSWLVFGMRGNTFRSDDDGATWEAVEVSDENSLFGGLVLADGAVVLVGAMNTVLLADQGLTGFQALADSRQGALTAVIQGNDGRTLLVAGEKGVATVPLPEAIVYGGAQ